MTDKKAVQDFVYALSPSPGFEHDGICFAGCHAGLYRSDDGGFNWRSAQDSLNLQSPLATTAVAVSPDFVSDRCVFAGVNGGILRSVDGGETWNFVTLPPPPPQVSCIVASPNFAKDGVLLAGTLEDGVFHSSDRGCSWVAWNFRLLDLHILALGISPSFADDETIFAGTDTGIFRSKNGGRAWREVGFPTEFAPVLSVALSPNYARDKVMFAGTESSGLLRSGDRGETWVHQGESEMAGPVNVVLPSPDFPGKPDVLVVSGGKLLVSRDDGHSWSEWKVALPDGQEVVCAAAPQGLGAGAPLLVGLLDGRVLRI